MKNHKWNLVDDVCERCGVEREPAALESYQHLHFSTGVPYKYLVDGVWQTTRPNCVNDKTEQPLTEKEI